VDGDEDVLRTSTTGSEQRASRIDFVDYNLEVVFLSFLSIFLSFFSPPLFLLSFFSSQCRSVARAPSSNSMMISSDSL
jgi:hypothetical protein